MKKEWCKEHITERNNWLVTQSGKKIEIQDDWKLCPICGAPRPKNKKELWEVIVDAYGKTVPEYSWSNKAAQNAKQWFLEQLDEQELSKILARAYSEEEYTSGVSTCLFMAREIIKSLKKIIN